VGRSRSVHLTARRQPSLGEGPSVTRLSRATRSARSWRYAREHGEQAAVAGGLDFSRRPRSDRRVFPRRHRLPMVVWADGAPRSLAASSRRFTRSRRRVRRRQPRRLPLRAPSSAHGRSDPAIRVGPVSGCGSPGGADTRSHCGRWYGAARVAEFAPSCGRLLARHPVALHDPSVALRGISGPRY